MTFKKLDPDLKSAWIKALRSGDYNQTKSALYRDSTQGFCCLGVLALIAGYTTIEIEGYRELSALGRDDLLGPWSLDGSLFRPELKEHDSLQRTLASMNDRGLSFDEIADWIETNI